MSVNVFLDDTSSSGDFQGENGRDGDSGPARHWVTDQGGGRAAGGLWYTVHNEGVNTILASLWEKVGEGIRAAARLSLDSAGTYRRPGEWQGSGPHRRAASKPADPFEPAIRLLGRGHWAISSRLAAIILCNLGTSPDDGTLRRIGPDDVLLLRWIDDSGRKMIVVEADGTTRMHYALPGGDGWAKRLLAFWIACEENGIEAGLRDNEMIIMDAAEPILIGLGQSTGEAFQGTPDGFSAGDESSASEESNIEAGSYAQFKWEYWLMQTEHGRLVRRPQAATPWPWEEVGPCETEQREARRGSPEGMPMNGPLASAERAA